MRRKRMDDVISEDELEDIGVTTKLLELQSALLAKTDAMENQAD